MDIEQLSSASSGKLVTFEDAQVNGGVVNDTYFLTVVGQAPCLNMDIALVPLIYIDCPDYWGIEVVGTLRGGFCLTAMKPYSVTIPLGGIIGRQGIEVIGGDRTERFELPGGCG